MKHFYVIVFFFLFSLGYAQESVSSGDIEGFELYPNPVTHGKIYINTALNAPKNIFIFDVLGTQVLQTTILGKELNLSELPAGIYVLRVMELNKVATRKLIVK